MSAQNVTVGWKEVRNRELSDIITRRQAVGLLAGKVLGELIEKWLHVDYAPGNEAELAAMLEEWLDIGMLTPTAFREIVGRWEAIHGAPSAQNPMTDKQCNAILEQPTFRELTDLLRPRDLEDLVELLPKDSREAIQQWWRDKGWLAATESPLEPLPMPVSPEVLDGLDERAREDLRQAVKTHRVEQFKNLLKRRGDQNAPPLGTLSSIREKAGRDGKQANNVHPHNEDKDYQDYQKLADSEWRSPTEAHALDALILEALLRAEVSKDLVGLALSGGGIRSASFNLGLVQVLQKDKLLRDMDFLSTVSGGGYVGSFLSSMVHNNDVQMDPTKSKELPLATGPDGKQPETVVKLVRSGSFLNHPMLHASRYLMGVLLNNLVLLTALVAFCTAAALGWRSLDTHACDALLRWYSNEWVSDWNRPFLPGLGMLAIWFIVSAVFLVRYGPHGQPRFGHVLLTTAGVCLLIGAAVWLAAPNLVLPQRSSSSPKMPALIPLGNTPAVILMILAVGGLVPFLKPWRFLASGTQPSGQGEQVTFRILSILLLGGIPFFLVYMIARHDIANQVSWYGTKDYSERSDLELTDIQYSRWSSFWSHLIQQAEEDGTVGASVWSRLDGIHKEIVSTLSRKSCDEIHKALERQGLSDQPNPRDSYTDPEVVRAAINSVPVPLNDGAKNVKIEIVKAINQKVIGDPTFTKAVLGKRHGGPNETEKLIRTRSEKMEEGERLRRYLDAYHHNRLTDADKQTLNRLLLEAYYGWAVWERAIVRRSIVIDQDQSFRWAFLGMTAGLAFLSSLVVGLNSTSLHGIYRQQLAWLYLHPVGQKKPDPYLRLHEVDTTSKGAPYHLITASLDKGSLRQEGTRPTVQFLMSRRFCGSTYTGFVATQDYLADEQGGTLDLPTAMAISGAAFSPARVDNRLIAFLMLVLNVRLGQWLPSPRFPVLPRCLPWLKLLLSLAIFRGVKNRRFWFITDGGHCENLGLGPLLRRECKLIIVSDAGYDPDYGFDDFIQLYRHARTQGIRFQTLDQSGFIRMDALMPDKATGLSPHRYLVARIEYPGPEKKWGLLIYLKPSFAGDEAADIMRYRRLNTKFPHDPTVNQWFSEDQVESYRELGAWIGQRVTQALAGKFKERYQRPVNFDEVVRAMEQAARRKGEDRAESAAPAQAPQLELPVKV